MENAIIIAIIGGASGIITAVTTAIFKILDYRKLQKGETLDARFKPFLDKMNTLEEELHEIRLDTTRTQLLMLMEHQPRNHDTILKVAHRYFCELFGNWYMAVEFQRWADAQHISIPPSISQAITENEHRQ